MIKSVAWVRMPKIKNIDHLKTNIKRSLAIVFTAIFMFALIILYVLHGRYMRSEAELNQQEVRGTIETFKSDLSEKLSILASSNTFIDFLRSGSVTREKMYPDFFSQIITLKSQSISGMKLSNQWGEVIFNYGNVSREKISLDLCYLNQVLDAKTGDCEFTWTLFFNKKQLLSDLHSANPKIEFCQNCNKIPLLTNNRFGSFKATPDFGFELPVGVYLKWDYYFYFYALVMIISLGMLGAWCWFRLNDLLNNYIVEPINNLIGCLKADLVSQDESQIDEIKYLICEISDWRIKINKIKTEENIEKLAKFAAQLAHDIRSPLGAIDMVLKKIDSQIPEAHHKLLVGATHRIDDIAANFLHQYRNVDVESKNLPLQPVYLPELINDIVLEKRSQYMDSLIQFHFDLSLSDKLVIATINLIEFKRLISNLLNNAAESINGHGCVNISVSGLDRYIVIKVSDNGRGIPSHLLHLIAKGGFSTGKTYGNGLGLSHARSMIEMWGGSMDITSVEGEGTSISLMLPKVTSPKTPSL